MGSGSSLSLNTPRVPHAGQGSLQGVAESQPRARQGQGPPVGRVPRLLEKNLRGMD